MRHYYLLLLALLFAQASTAQNVTVKVTDASTGESIPYANITLNGTENLVSNAEGYFTISDNASESSTIAISYLGYVGQNTTLENIKKQQHTVRLQPGMFELDAVDVSKVKQDPNAIMAEVKRNLTRNYKSEEDITKDMMFQRTASVFKPLKLEFEIKKSTGFSKQALKTTNSDLKKFTNSLVEKPPVVFTDILMNLYKSSDIAENKTTSKQKLEVIKATKLRDESRSADFDQLEHSVGKIFLQHVDSTKYYRFKSGWIGTRDTISLRSDFNKKKKTKNKNVKSQVEQSKFNLTQFLSESNFASTTTLDFVNNPELYQYTYDGAIYSAENEFVYVLKFKPKKNKAKFEGTMYVSENDFAVVRADYGLVSGKKLGGANFKMLLGLKYSQNLSKGTLIYAPRPSGSGYYLRYASTETGNYIYINRPLKLIELTEVEKDVVAFDIKIEGNSIQKVEFLNIAHNEIPKTQFDDVSEPDFAYLPLKKYDPNVWKNYSAIEPLEEMKQFKVVE